MGQLVARGIKEIQLRWVVAAQLTQRLVDMPVHGNVLLHVEIAHTSGQSAEASVIIAGQLEVVRCAADVANVGANIDVIVEIGVGERLAGFRTSRIADAGNGCVRQTWTADNRTDDAGAGRDVQEGCREATAHIGPTEVVIDAPIVIQIVAKLTAQRGCLGGDTVHLHPLKHAVAVKDQKVFVID